MWDVIVVQEKKTEKLKLAIPISRSNKQNNLLLLNSLPKMPEQQTPALHILAFQLMLTTST